MAARSKARKRAVDVLYAADLRGTDRLEMLAQEQATGQVPVHEYTVALVEGVAAHAAEIDRLVGEFATGWSLERLPDVDRAILRMAVFELLWEDDVPDAVVIDEAVTLAKTLSTDDSPAFVNGVLAAIADAATSSSSRTTPRPGAVPDGR